MAWTTWSFRLWLRHSRTYKTSSLSSSNRQPLVISLWSRSQNCSNEWFRTTCRSLNLSIAKWFQQFRRDLCKRSHKGVTYSLCHWLIVTFRIRQSRSWRELLWIPTTSSMWTWVGVRRWSARGPASLRQLKLITSSGAFVWLVILWLRRILKLWRTSFFSLRKILSCST